MSWVRLEGWAAGLLGARAREAQPMGPGDRTDPSGAAQPIADGELRGAAGEVLPAVARRRKAQSGQAPEHRQPELSRFRLPSTGVRWTHSQSGSCPLG